MVDVSDGLTRTSSVYTGRHELQLVLFKVGEWELGVDVADVSGIYHGMPMIPTPDSPDTLAGEIQISGERVPTVSLARLFGIERPLKNGNWWMIVLHLAGGPLALIADEMKEVVKLDASALGLSTGNQHPAKQFAVAVARYQGRAIYLLNYRLLAQELRS
jgi:chemotaxis signal transduction protein